ncbi:serine/threonine kinase [Synechococcus phage S-H34]|uniref:Serine/threonine kinase n=1 Tax=Synechococcus phage S-H34 TaxID=2718942 RepID=A0A6G8R6M0_9CAUD|nr:serine/threonine kinase [Synechococcus phage S-H34]QIN97051.1 serine/threonine kinase [Synechococcus phage S-H34]
MRLSQFNENAESEAHKEALARGLKYKGFGYWADNSGKVVARTLGGKLQPVEKDEAEGDGNKADVAQMAKGKSYDDIAGGAPQEPVEMGEVLPGEEKAKKEDGQWEPGPDGDTQVGEEPSEIEDDVFVDKDQDSDKWVAGADGSNFKNFKSFDAMKEHFHDTKKSPLWAGKQGESPSVQARKRGLNSDGHGYWVDNAGNPVAKTEGDKLVDLTPEEIKRHDLGSRIPGRTTMRDMMKGKREPGGIMKNRIPVAQGAIAHLSPSERDKYIDDRLATKDGEYKKGKDKGPYHKAADAQRAIDKMGAKDYAEYKEVQELNQDAKQYFIDPEYDLTDDNLGDELGSGAFGSVYLSEDGENVIKDGQIGRDEMMALDLLKEVPGFPRLINAEFTSGFKSISTWSNDGITVDSEDQVMGGTFWNNSEAAMGRYAMSLADGMPVSDAQYGWDEVTQENATLNFWNLMAEMHKRGVSHNDMHGGNIFFNDELQPTILDLGLARVDSFTALMEALASQNDNNYQLYFGLEMQNLPQEQIDILEANRAKVIELISDDYSGDEWTDEQREKLVELMQGDIRLTQQQIDEFREELDMEDEQIQDYIEMLYEGFGVEPEVEDNRSELEKRMEGGYKAMLDKIAAKAGYSDGEAMKGMFNAANNLRRDRGEEDIPFKGVDITRDPRKNK